MADDIGYYIDGLPYLPIRDDTGFVVGRKYILDQRNDYDKREGLDKLRSKCDERISNYFDYDLILWKSNIESYYDKLYVNGVKLKVQDKEHYKNVGVFCKHIGMCRRPIRILKDPPQSLLQNQPPEILDKIFEHVGDSELLRLSEMGNEKVKSVSLHILGKRNKDPFHDPGIVWTKKMGDIDHYIELAQKAPVKFITKVYLKKLKGIHTLVYNGNKKSVTFKNILCVNASINDRLKDQDSDKLTTVKVENVHTLILKNRKKLEKIDGVNTLHTLNLRKCSKFRDVESLKDIPVLDLSLTGIYDVSNLGNVRSLTMDQINYASQFAYARSRVETHYTDPMRQHDVVGLENLHNLVYVNLTGSGVTDVSALSNVRTVNLSWTHRLENVDALNNVYELILEGFEIEDVNFDTFNNCILVKPDGEKIVKQYNC